MATASEAPDQDPVAASIANELEDLLEIGDAPEDLPKTLPPLPPGVSPRDVLLYPGNKIFQGVDSPLTPFWMNSSPGTPQWLKGEFPKSPAPQGVKDLLRSPAWTLSPLKNTMRRTVTEGGLTEEIIFHTAQREKPMMPAHWQSLDLQRIVEPEGEAPEEGVGKWHKVSQASGDFLSASVGQAAAPQKNSGEQLPEIALRETLARPEAEPLRKERSEPPPPSSGAASLLVLERDSALLKGWAAQTTASHNDGKVLDKPDSGMSNSSLRQSKSLKLRSRESQPFDVELRKSIDRTVSEPPRGSILKRRAFKPLTSLVTKSPRAEEKTGPRRKRGFLAEPLSASEAEGFWEDEDMPEAQLVGQDDEQMPTLPSLFPWDATSPMTLLDGTSIQTLIEGLNNPRSEPQENASTSPLLVPTVPSPSMAVFGFLSPLSHTQSDLLAQNIAQRRAGTAIPTDRSSNPLLRGAANRATVAQVLPTLQPQARTVDAGNLAAFEAFLRQPPTEAASVPLGGTPAALIPGGGENAAWASFFANAATLGKATPSKSRAPQNIARPSISTLPLPRRGGSKSPGRSDPQAFAPRGAAPSTVPLGDAPPPAAMNLSWLGEWQHQEAVRSPTDANYVSFTICGNTFEIPANFKPGKLVGRSQQGDVCAAILADCGEEFAVRKISNAFRNACEARRTLREIRLLQHLKHDNIIAFKGVLPPPSLRSFRDVYIAFELMDSDLFHLLASEEPLSESHCQFFLYQLLRGLKYLHSADVLHRDLKPSSILVNAACDLKISDFGASRSLSSSEWGDEAATEVVAKRWYRPPELLLACSQTTAAVDVWSSGCILAELLLKRPLFPGVDALHQLNLIMEVLGSPSNAELAFVTSSKSRDFVRSLSRPQKKPWKSVVPEASDKALDLLNRMLTFDPARRITVDAALAHPYLAHLHDPSDVPTARQPFAFTANLPGMENHVATIEAVQRILYDESRAAWR